MVKLLAAFSASDPEVTAVAARKFAAYLADQNTEELPADFKVEALRIAMSTGGAAELEKMIALYPSAKTNIDEKHIMGSLGAIPGVELKRRVLDWAYSVEAGKSPKPQDIVFTVKGVSDCGVEGAQTTWEYFKTNFSHISKVLHAGLMDRAITFSTAGLRSEEAAADIEQFFEANPMPGNTRAISQQVEAIRTNAKFLKDRILPSKLVDPAFWSKLSGPSGAWST